MANDGILKTNAFDQIVRDANSFDEMRDALHRAQGLASTEQTIIDGGYRAAPAEPSAPLPIAQYADRGAPPTHIRVIYPFSNSRFELVGYSEEDLDLQEQKIRALYQK